MEFGTEEENFSWTGCCVTAFIYSCVVVEQRTKLTVHCVTAVPKRIDTAFRNWEYIPYSLMTRKALEKQDLRKEAMIISQSGAFQPAPLDESGEEAVEIGDWHGAALLAEELMRKHWESEREQRLIAHHRIVVTLISQQGWPVARKYDITIRRKAAADSTRDLATLDSVQLSLVIAEVGQAIQPLASNWSSSAVEPPSIAGTSHGSGAGKRSRASDEGGSRPAKLPRQTKCFRCEVTGHVQAICKATSTSAGRPCAGVVIKNRVPTLVNTTGSQFCFN